MLAPGALVPAIPGVTFDSTTLVVIFETDCPTCRLTFPYLNKLARAANVVGISQDDEASTNAFRQQLAPEFPIYPDPTFAITNAFDPMFVPALFLIDKQHRILRAHFGFDKRELNIIAQDLGAAPIADKFDSNPATKPGGMSRHLEPAAADFTPIIEGARPTTASRIELADTADPFEYCFQQFGDALPVIPPTDARVDHMLGDLALPRSAVIARIPPCYGEATVEKIAANAVMAGCKPSMMRVLIPLVRAVCDERFNIHGVQATTHFAAPLIIVNGPIRDELEFNYRQNLLSNTARANSTLGRALQLILLNIGGARPDGIDMSTLGNPGKFSYCIAEHEEQSPWEPFHVTRGFNPGDSTVSLFAATPPQGVSEHTARTPEQVLKAICYSLATVWSYRACLNFEAVVILCPEHARTIAAAKWTRQQTVDFLFENTGIPVREYENAAGAEGTQMTAQYQEIIIDGQRCFRKFRAADQIRIVVAGGTAGKFSAVIGSWTTGPRGSEMVTYPI